MIQLEEKRAELALARKRYEDRKAALDAARAAWEDAHSDLIEAVAKLKVDMDAADTTLRDVALEVYAVDLDNKKLVEGVEVKLWDVTRYDPVKALAWARIFMPGLLILDAKAYDKLLREVRASKTLSSIITDMPGEVAQEPKVSIARDLSEYLIIQSESAPAPEQGEAA